MKKFMHEISREQAEELFQISRILEKKIEQTSEELKLSFSLSNKNSLQIIYNLKNHHQTYFAKIPP
ncbi:MAG: hypothetical protein JXL67_00805, partial [Calditrichaeota bacterium]|nr:hypothetical protein [Calditrichota bacterium]